MQAAEEKGDAGMVGGEGKVINAKKNEPSLVIGLSPEDAARALGVSKRTLQEMVRLGEIPCAKRKQTQVFDPEDLKAWLAANKSKVTNGVNLD